ncbi:Inhibitor of growth protein 5 [Dinochytrium kinnereticum]|nr:Inhibitor of growth protein 5 [Dinochytrium kinnereticum]
MNDDGCSRRAQATNTPQPAAIQDYLDTVESLPLELTRNFSLLRELDSTAQDISRTLETESAGFVETVADLTTEEKLEKIRTLTLVFRDYLKHGEDKVALAIQTYDLVDRHIRRLDEDLAKYDEEQMTGPKIASSSSMTRDEARALKAAEKATSLNTATVTANSSISSMKAVEGRRGAGNSVVESKLMPSNDTPSKKRKTKDRQMEKSLPPEPVKEVTPRKDKNGKTSVAPPPKAPANNKKNEKNRKVLDILVKTASAETTKIATASQAKLSAQDLPIDPNEPKYCICQQVSFGEMV